MVSTAIKERGEELELEEVSSARLYNIRHNTARIKAELRGKVSFHQDSALSLVLCRLPGDVRKHTGIRSGAAKHIMEEDC